MIAYNLNKLKVEAIWIQMRQLFLGVGLSGYERRHNEESFQTRKEMISEYS